MTRWWLFFPLYYYATFFVGDPRPLGDFKWVFHCAAAVIVVASAVGVCFPSIKINIVVGSLSVAHGLASSFTALVVSEHLDHVVVSQISRLGFVGVVFFFVAKEINFRCVRGRGV